ncbi:MAG: M14 family zinc carboxypeptidase, partial [Candidatus Polarisedimenticolia bacterium]
MTIAAALVLAVAFSPSLSTEPDTPEPGSIEAIASATTDPRFLSPWVAYVPDHPKVPSPADVLGHIAGAPGELSRTAQIYGYFRALDAASPRVRVETVATSEEGRDILLAIVADEPVLREIERYREATGLLADPRRCDEACLERTLGFARPIYYLNGGLHSTETGSPEMLMELAYRLAVSERPEIRAIRENVIVLINPVSEPDGRDRAVDWFYRYLKGRTDYDDLPETSPPYWGKYVFHDNNRDGHQRELALTRAVQDTFLRWHPQVVHDLHESIPLLLIWTGTGPYNHRMDPILIGEWHEMAFHEVRTLSSLGMPGVWTWAFGEGWGHMFLDSVGVNHNAVGRGYETFGITSAETMDVKLDLRDEEYAGQPVTRRTWYRPWPPPRAFRWSLRNNTNYMQTGVLSILQYAALHGKEMLRDFHRKGTRAVERGRAEPPYAFAIPETQADRGRLALLVNRLRAHGIEVSRAPAPFKVEGIDAPAGTYVVRLDQPYRGFALDLLERQDYPAKEAPYEPYDDVSWALSHHYGVEVVRVDDPKVRDVPLDPVAAEVAYPGRVDGGGPVYLVRDTGQEALFAARFALGRFRVEAAEKPFASGGADFPAGSWILPAQRGLAEALRAAAARHGIDVASAAAAPDVPRHPLDLPRLAVFATWNDSQAAGWVRMHFDRAGVAYTYIKDDDVKRGALNERFDVILYPHSHESPARIAHGIDPRHGPMPYTRTAAFPSHGTPAASPDITGGLTYRGLANLEEFVRRGGLLVTLGGASALPLEGGFTRDVRRARAPSLHTPGVEIRARFARPDHPIAYGYGEVTSVFREELPLYETPESRLGTVVLQWGTRPPRFADEKAKGDGEWSEAGREGAAPGPEAKPAAEEKKEPQAGLVVSGGMKGEDELEGKPAILDLAVDRGRVVAFNFDPIHRLLSRSDFRLAWNAILNWNDLPAPPA